MAMAMELARVVQQERLMEAETRRRRQAAKRMAAERAAEERAKARPASGEQDGPKVEWPVFSLRIGRYQFVGFKTVRL